MGAGGLTILFLFPSLLLRGVTEGLDLFSARGEARRERLNTLPQEENACTLWIDNFNASGNIYPFNRSEISI